MGSDFNALCRSRDLRGESERERHLYASMHARQASSQTVATRGKGSRSKETLVAIVLFLLMCSVSTVLRAQSAASINGTVKDSTGALLSGANVVLTNSDTGVKQQATTNTSGIYAIPNVRPGSYAIVVDKDGFESVKETQVVLQVNQAATFNFSLAVGAIVSTVEVSSGASSVETSTAELGTVITTRAVNDLPLNGRNFTQLLELTPGVSRVSVDQNSTGGGGISGNAIGTFTFPSVNGQRNRSNMFMLDGVNDLGRTSERTTTNLSLMAFRSSRCSPTMIWPSLVESPAGSSTS
jgi:Carboxypeptidase regulatory-like domain